MDGQKSPNDCSNLPCVCIFADSENLAMPRPMDTCDFVPKGLTLTHVCMLLDPTCNKYCDLIG